MAELILIKTVVSVFIIIALSLVAEHVSPRVSGIISGYPLGAAITLFFLGYEISPEFAASSAVYTVLGLISSQVLAFIYYLISAQTKSFSVLLSSLCGVAGFIASSFLLGIIHLDALLILPVTCLATLGFHLLFRKIDDPLITNKKQFSLTMLFGRATASATLILLITGAAKAIGPKWAGLFSSFPLTLFPLLVIIHITYQAEHVHSIIKNLPSGLGSLIFYLVLIHYSYPAFGLFSGTLLGFLGSTIYLLIVLFISGKCAKKRC